jgi:hypothetical protein
MRAVAAAIALLWASVAHGNECVRSRDGSVVCSQQGFELLVSEARFQQATREKCEATNARLLVKIQAAKARADAAEAAQSSLLPVVAAAGAGVLVGVALSLLAR